METRRTDSRKEIYNKIDDEREYQDNKWGIQQKNNYIWASILTEEVGEAHKAILEGNKIRLQREIIQVIAVGVAWLENIKQGCFNE